MEFRWVEVTIISAQDLKDVKTIGKMSPYAVAWIYPDAKVSTPVHPKGGVNPTWNANITLKCDDRGIEQGNAVMTIDIYNHGTVGNKQIGSVSIPLSQGLPSFSAAKGKDPTKMVESEAKLMSYQVCN
jgi:Ca2+-dependent lipid-binding protein